MLQENVSSFSPYDSEGYDEGVQVTMTCTDTYITSWASTVNDTEGNIKCVSLSWVPEPLVEGFDREVGCVGKFNLSFYHLISSLTLVSIIEFRSRLFSNYCFTRQIFYFH